MPNSDSIVTPADISPPAFVCSHANIGLDAALVHVAGELDTLTGTTDAVETADVDPGDPPVQALRHLADPGRA